MSGFATGPVGGVNAAAAALAASTAGSMPAAAARARQLSKDDPVRKQRPGSGRKQSAGEGEDLVEIDQVEAIEAARSVSENSSEDAQQDRKSQVGNTRSGGDDRPPLDITG